jgi:hypothetical protein
VARRGVERKGGRGGGVGSRCGVRCETRQREGGLAHTMVRRGAGASNGGLGSGGVVLTCRTGKDARARGVRLGKEIGVWATFHGCGPVALGRPKGIVLFSFIQKNSNGFESIQSKDDFPEFEKIQMKYGLNKEQFSLFKLYKIQNGF